MAASTGPSFSVRGIEPPGVREADPAERLAYWRAVLALTLEAKDRELAKGLDRYGRPMRALARSTIRNRHSEMGPADPGAPPLQPAHGLSRTRALLTGRATASGVICWWMVDRHTGASWGDILAIHRAGNSRLPRRDVIGLSPASKAMVAEEAAKWWKKRQAAKGDGSPPRFGKHVPPPEKPKFLTERVPTAARGVSELRINGDHYTFGSGSASQVREMIANGTFTGFRSGAKVRAKLEARGATRKADGSVDWAKYFADQRGKAPSPTSPPPKPPPPPPPKQVAAMRPDPARSASPSPPLPKPTSGRPSEESLAPGPGFSRGTRPPNRPPATSADQEPDFESTAAVIRRWIAGLFRRRKR